MHVCMRVKTKRERRTERRREKKSSGEKLRWRGRREVQRRGHGVGDGQR